MAKNTGVAKERIGNVLAMVEEGTYRIEASTGNLYKGEKLIKGSVGTEDGQRWYNIKGMSLQGQRLMYAYYNGLDALDLAKVVKHLDGDKLNNAKGNLVQVSKNGWKAELEALRDSNAQVVEATGEIVVSTEFAPEPVQPEQPELFTMYTEKEREARAIMQLVNEGKTIKEVAEICNVKTSRVYDVKRGKSNASATADMRN